MNNIKQSSVDGFFYPGSPETLTTTLQELIRHGKDYENIAAPKAIIVPHAVYTSSGTVAATVYKTLIPAKKIIKRVVLLGPAHKLAFSGIATTNCEGFATPLGIVPVDLQAIASTLDLPSIKILEHAYDMEHSLEVQLPFLQFLLKDFILVPYVIGNAQPQDIADLLLHLWGGPETLIVISSDLSHYYDYDTAKKFDLAASKAITDLNPNELQDHHACGRCAIKGLLLAAAKLQLQAKVLDLKNSGDISGAKDRVVGYGAYHFQEPDR